MNYQKRTRTKRKDLDENHGKKSKRYFSPKKQYIRKRKNKNYTNERKKKTYKCDICIGEDHYTTQCTRKVKGGKKMIKFLKEEEFEILYEEEIFDVEEILSELSSEEKSSSKEEVVIFMVQGKDIVD